MTDFGKFFRYENGTLVPISSGEPEVQLAVADSFLVDNGKVRSLEAHFARFSDSVNKLDPHNASQLKGFCDAVVAAIPPQGRWFPRIEWHGEAPAGQHLYLRLREAPEQLTSMVLWTLDTPDPRSNPLVKGPDLSLGQQLRRKAILHGADETVLVDAHGYVSEGALSALVWWRGDILCAPDHEITWLDSITRREVFAIAEQMGFETRLEKSRPADLIGLEIWGLSSFQGIRPVTGWVNLGGPVGHPKHSDDFQRRLKLLAHTIG